MVGTYRKAEVIISPEAYEIDFVNENKFLTEVCINKEVKNLEVFIDELSKNNYSLNYSLN